MVKLPVLILIAFITLASCSSGMYEMLHRTLDDPQIVIPNVESFEEKNTIFINWDFDEGADEYILERAEDKMELHYQIIYKGKDLNFADRGLEDDKRYIYRLSKRRGNRIFGPSDEALGVSTILTRDVYRNNSMAQAIKLDSIDYIANMFFYRSYGGLELVEEDWYYIDLPPLRMASIVVNDSQVPDAGMPHILCTMYIPEKINQ